MSHIYDYLGKKLSIDKLLNGPDGKIWTQALSNEIGRLTKENDAGVSWTNTMVLIHKFEVPTSKKVTYCSFVCDQRPYKKEPNRIRLVVGGDKLDGCIMLEQPYGIIKRCNMLEQPYCMDNTP